MTAIEAIETRRSVKHYDPNHRLTDAEIARLVELAKLAPSSFNMQNYRFVLAIGKQAKPVWPPGERLPNDEVVVNDRYPAT